MRTKIFLCLFSFLMISSLCYGKGPKTFSAIVRATESSPAKIGSALPSQIPGRMAIEALPKVSVPLAVQEANRVVSSRVLNSQLQSSVDRALASSRLILPAPSVPERLEGVGSSPAPIPPEDYTFLAVRDKPELDAPTFTGTLFEINYNGEKKVFGVIASHATGLGALGRNFTAVISQGGKRIQIPARVVQISARSFLDVSLVQLDLSYAPFVRALPLSNTPVQVGDELHSDGFEGDIITPVQGRFAVEVSPTSVRTTMPVVRRLRSGLCGSAVLNEKNELVGIHTGSTRSSESYHTDKGYFVPVSVLEALVKAYYNQGKGFVPFTIQGQTIAYFGVDEYIVDLELTNEDGKHIWHTSPEGKFSHTELANELKQRPEARYIHILTHRTFWDPSGLTLLESRQEAHGTAKRYMYDLKEKVLVYAIEVGE